MLHSRININIMYTINEFNTRFIAVGVNKRFPRTSITLSCDAKLILVNNTA